MRIHNYLFCAVHVNLVSHSVDIIVLHVQVADLLKALNLEIIRSLLNHFPATDYHNVSTEQPQMKQLVLNSNSKLVKLH